MKNKTNILAILILLGFITSSAYSQQVTISLTPAPPGQIKIAQCWNMTITNNDSNTYEGFLEGSITHSKDGKVVTAKSNGFVIKPGTKTYTEKDIPGATYQISSEKYRGIETGNPPPGKYSLCIELKSKQRLLAKDCQEISIEEQEQTHMISLVSPGKDDDIDEKTSVNFVWTGTGLKGPYTLQIVELKKGQTEEQAFKENRASFEKNGINSTTFQYPISEKKFEAGKKYAWQVISADAKSEVFTFSIINHDVTDGDKYFDDLYVTLSQLETNSSSLDNAQREKLVVKMQSDSLGLNDLKQTLIDFYKLNSEDLEYVLEQIRLKNYTKKGNKDGDFSEIEKQEPIIKKLCSDLNKYSMEKFKQPFHISALKKNDIYADSVMVNYKTIASCGLQGGDCPIWDLQDYASQTACYNAWHLPQYYFNPRKNTNGICNLYGFMYEKNVGLIGSCNPSVLLMISLNGFGNKLMRSGTQLATKCIPMILAGTTPGFLRWTLWVTWR